MGGLVVRALQAMVKVTVVGENGEPKVAPVGFNPDGSAHVEPVTRIVMVGRGEPLPDRLAAGELERLKSIGALGTPDEAANAQQTAGEPADPDSDPAPPTPSLDTLASLTGTDLEAAVKDNGIQKLLDAIGEDADLAARVLDAEKSITNGSPRDGLVKGIAKLTTPAEPKTDAPAVVLDLGKLSGYTDEDIASGLGAQGAPGAKKLLDAIGTDKALAARVLAAEKSRSGEPRSSLVNPLEKLVAEPAA